jgi:hypothetical protein
MAKEPKGELVKARVSQTMKDAVTNAAAARGAGGEAEAMILREALTEYLERRGFIKSDAASLRIAKEPQERPPKSSGSATTSKKRRRGAA